jgi:hypothetical protein
MSKVQPFAEILSSYKRQFMPPGSGGELAEYFLNQAYSINYWTVHDALRDMLTSTACLVGTTQMGTYYARYGVARRLRDVFFGFRNIYAVTPPDRTEPLETDETSSVSRDLNMIYINLIGITDNLAWFLLMEENPESVTNLPKTEIGLFKKAIFKNSRFQSL